MPSLRLTSLTSLDLGLEWVLYTTLKAARLENLRKGVFSIRELYLQALSYFVDHPKSADDGHKIIDLVGVLNQMIASSSIQKRSFG